MQVLHSVLDSVVYDTKCSLVTMCNCAHEEYAQSHVTLIRSISSFQSGGNEAKDMGGIVASIIKSPYTIGKSIYDSLVVRL